jgi:hypothetical protein
LDCALQETVSWPAPDATTELTVGPTVRVVHVVADALAAGADVQLETVSVATTQQM